MSAPLGPDLDPRDLDPVSEPPDDDDLVEADVDGAGWAGLELSGVRIARTYAIAAIAPIDAPIAM